MDTTHTDPTSTLRITAPLATRANGPSLRGRPTEVRVQQSSGFPRLDQAAVEGLKRWRFQSAMRDGLATSAWTTVRVRFRLDA